MKQKATIKRLIFYAIIIFSISLPSQPTKRILQYLCLNQMNNIQICYILNRYRRIRLLLNDDNLIFEE
jgi:hypothetical protein